MPAYNDAATLTNSSGTSGKYLYALSDYGGYVGVAVGQGSYGYGRVVKTQSLNKLANISAEDFFLSDGAWYVEAQGDEYPVSESVEVYISDGDCWLSGETGLANVLADGYDLTLYYDRSPSKGGQIRIMIARSGD